MYPSSPVPELERMKGDADTDPWIGSMKLAILIGKASTCTHVLISTHLCVKGSISMSQLKL